MYEAEPLQDWLEAYWARDDGRRNDATIGGSYLAKLVTNVVLHDKDLVELTDMVTVIRERLDSMRNATARIAALEAENAALREQVATLKEQFAELRSLVAERGKNERLG